jgi:hypothetical protein
MTRNLIPALVLQLILGAACGGGKKGEDTGPDNGGGGDDTAYEDPCAENGGMCPPEMLEEIQNDLDRKSNVATRCLTDAIDSGEVDKDTKAKITLDFVIQPSGKARDINVARSSIEAQSFQDCVIEVVAGISFPNVPKDLDWSYTYAFESF